MIRSMERSIAEIEDRLKITQAEELAQVWRKKTGIDFANNKEADDAIGGLADIARHVGNSAKRAKDITDAFSVWRRSVTTREGLREVLELERDFQEIQKAIQKASGFFEKLKDEQGTVRSHKK